ncbi:MAG: hypothetical protein IKR76_09110 [Ruminococcus sp.]|nr:hypothetical protein [Ruminococcus sp.]
MNNPLLLLIIIPVTLIFGLLFAGDMSKTVYTCQCCGHRFRAPWYKFLWNAHYDTDKIMKCPKCGKRNECVISYDQKL